MATSLSKRVVVGVILIGLLAVVTYLLTAATGRSQGVDPVVSVTSATAQPNSHVAVDFVVTPPPGVTLGVLGIVITYDSALLSAYSCLTFVGMSDCNPNISTNQAGLAWVSVSGDIGGPVGTLRFNTLDSGGVALLDVTVTTCADDAGEYLTCAATDGEITIVQPTPSPSPNPTATPQPTPTPSPTPTPGPSPTASPAPRRWGDVNCDGVVTAVDALAILRKVAGLPVFQVAPCPTIGAAYPQPIGGK